MTVKTPRIIPPEEARVWVLEEDETLRDLAYTVTVLSERVDAALGLHTGDHWCADETDTALIPWEEEMGSCPTARALGETLGGV